MDIINSMEDNDPQPATISSMSLTAPVSEAESGQKLLQFLARRLNLSTNLLHRWIRTGQIRLNGRRCKPFDRICYGDVIRIPPFATAMAMEAREDDDMVGDLTFPVNTAADAMPQPDGLADIQLPLLENWHNIWAVKKPAGLPTQSGTGHTDSVCSRLQSRYKQFFFKPVPGHRLDKDTSGILLVGGSFESLRQLQAQFQQAHVHKEYLALVKGVWPDSQPVLLSGFIRKESANGKTRAVVYSDRMPYARDADCIVRPLLETQGHTLLQIRLLSGRTHQIRAQLSRHGFPILGDGKYGIPGDSLRLHAFRIILPDGHQFGWLPDWAAEYGQTGLPDPLFAGVFGRKEAFPHLPEFK